MESKLSLCLREPKKLPVASSDTDPVTHLPRPKAFFVELETELNRSRRSGSSFAIVVCRVTSLKEINHREGLAVGNGFLRAVADRFREGCRPYDTVAHLGGSEFVFLMPHTADADLSERLFCISELVASARSSTCVKAEVPVSVGASFFPSDGDTAEDLLALADRRVSLQANFDGRPVSVPAELLGTAAV